jgi:hypothetical protein
MSINTMLTAVENRFPHHLDRGEDQDLVVCNLGVILLRYDVSILS